MNSTKVQRDEDNIILGLEAVELAFKGLLQLIYSGDKSVIHNRDSSHPRYITPYSGHTNDYPYNDFNPDKEVLFVGLKEMSQLLGEHEYNNCTWYRHIATWEDYQQLIHKEFGKGEPHTDLN